MFHVIAPCKGIFLTRHLGRNERSIVNLALTLFKSCIENKIIHVIELCKEMLSTRHLDRSWAKRNEAERSHTIICLQIIVSPVKDLKNKIIKYNCYVNFLKFHLVWKFHIDVSAIHLLLLKQKYEISPFR